MKITYEKAVQNVSHILTQLHGKLDDKDISEVVRYYELGEAVLSVEMMCEFLVEAEITLNQSLFFEIRSLCQDLELKDNYWRFLKTE